VRLDYHVHFSNLPATTLRTTGFEIILPQVAASMISDTRHPFSPRLLHFCEKVGVFLVIFGMKMHNRTGYATNWQLELS